jgi:predicted  nucleic acid-binding Zn-ribbon protein
MTPNEKTIANFETRIRQLIFRFQELKKENQDLYGTIEKSEKDIAELRAKLEQQQSDYQSLKMAKMIEITDGDLSGAKDRLAKLIREVNKCIAILTDEKE